MQVFRSTDSLASHLASLASLASADAEALSELDHGLQCAALLAQRHPHDTPLHLAGLVHDLAHVWDEPGQSRHAALAAKAVRPLLGDRVAGLVAGHVAAKRYLVTVEPDYRARLSPDSVRTLDAQGGALSDADTCAFRAHPQWRAMLALRRADDEAKVAGARVPGLDHWLPALYDLARPA